MSDTNGVGEYGYSPMTDTWYRLHNYEDLGDGKVRAQDKTEVDRSEVPQKILDETEERDTDE